MTDGYHVRVEPARAGWDTVVTDEAGTEVLRRSSSTEREAETFASAVRQHIAWLSPERFRAYYRIPDVG